MKEELLKNKITEILLDSIDGFNNKTIERLIMLFYEAQNKKRTGKQNSSLHLDCSLIAEKLEDAGCDMKKVIRLEIPPTMENVKEYIWKPVMKSLYGITSTTQLKKGEGQIEKIHDVILRELGKEWGIEWHDFPSKEQTEITYPGKHVGEVAF